MLSYLILSYYINTPPKGLATPGEIAGPEIAVRFEMPEALKARGA